MTPFRMNNCGNPSSRYSRARTLPDWWKAAEPYAPATTARLLGWSTIGTATPASIHRSCWRRHRFSLSKALPWGVPSFISSSSISTATANPPVMLLTTLNEKLKSGDVTVSHSRRWTDFEEYLIPRSHWAVQRTSHYEHLGLPLDVGTYLASLDQHLKTVTEQVDKRVPQNQALTIDDAKGKFHLAALKAADKPDTVKILKHFIESRLPKVDLVDILIDIDNQTNFLRH